MQPRPEDSTALARFPASVAQERCWVMEQMHPGNKGLNLAIRWELRGAASGALVEAAFQKIVDRHEILRTRFAEHDGQIQQEVVEHARFRLTRFDLRHVAKAHHAERIHAIAVEHAAERFDLTRPLLLRVAMVRIEPTRAILLIAVHNSIFDGFSIGVLGREFGTILSAMIEGRVPDLPELPLHYGDYALWERDYAASPAMADEKRYWCEHLKDMPYFEVPAARPRRPGEPEPGSIAHGLPPSFAEDMEAASRRQGASVFALGTAALAAALARLTKLREVSFAFQDSGRDDIDLEPLIGIFTNPLVVRLPVARETPLGGLIEASRSAIEAALANRHLPFDQLVKALNPPRDPLRIPLVSIMFNLQRVFLDERHYGPIELVSVPSHSPGTMYDLNINIIGRKTGWKLLIDYNKALFDAPQVEALASLYIEALSRISSDPDSRVEDLPAPNVAAPVDSLTGANGQVAGWAAEHARAPNHPVPTDAVQPATETDTNRHPTVPSPEPIAFEQLRAIWAEILALPPEKVDGDFFDLGGYSVLALRMLARAGDCFGTRPSLYRFLADPTLRGTAALLGLPLPDAVPGAPDTVLVSAALDLPDSRLPAALPAAEISGPGLPEPRNSASSPEAFSATRPAVDQAATAIWSLIELRRAEATAPVLLTLNQTFLYQSTARDLTSTAVVANLTIPDTEALALEGKLGLEAASEAAAQVVLDRYPGRRLLICGLCVDGRLGLRLAQALAARGAAPEAVVMIDTWAPGAAALLSARQKRADRWHLRGKRFRHYLALWARGKISTADLLSNYNSGAALLRRLRLRGPEPELDLLIRATVAQLVEQTKAHRFEPYPGEVLLIASEAQTSLGRDEMLGWSQILPADTALYRIKGWHGDALTRKGFDRISAILDARLLRLSRPRGSIRDG